MPPAPSSGEPPRDTPVQISRNSQRMALYRTLAVIAIFTAFYVAIVKWNTVLAMMKEIGRTLYG